MIRTEAGIRKSQHTRGKYGRETAIAEPFFAPVAILLKRHVVLLRVGGFHYISLAVYKVNMVVVRRVVVK